MKVKNTERLFYLLSYILILNTQAYGGQIEGNIKKLYQQLDQLNQLKATPRDCQHCLYFSEPESNTESTSNQEDPLLQQCALDLCGVPIESNNIYLFNNLFDKHKNTDRWDQQFSEQVEPLIREAILEEKKRRWNIVDALRTNLHDSKSGFQSTNTQTLNQIANVLFKNHVDFQIDPSSGSSTVIFTLPENASDIFKRGIESYAKQKKREIENSVHQTVYHTSDFIKDAPSIFMNRWNAFIAEYEEEKQKNPSFMRNFDEQMNQIREEVKEIKESPTIVFGLSKQLDQLLTEFEKFTDPQSDTQAVNLCKEEACQQALLENILNQYQQYEDGIDLGEILNHCRSQFTLANLVPKTDGLKSRVPDTKKKLFQKVITNYSRQSRKILREQFNKNLQIDFNNEVRFTDQVDNFLSKVRNKNQAPTPTGSFAYKGIGYAVGAPLTFISDELQFPEFNPSSICNYNPTRGSDFSLDHPKPTITMSVFDCTFHEYGKQSLAHEMGHALSYFFFRNQSQLSEPSYRKYKKLRQCVTRRYTVNNKNVPTGMLFHHEADKLKTEEDMADLISYQTFSNDSLVHQCAFLTPLKDGSKYQSPRIFQKPIKHISSDGTNVEGFYREDTHSAPLLRAIMEAIYKRIELPPTCQQVVDIYSEKGINFKPCSWTTLHTDRESK